MADLSGTENRHLSKPLPERDNNDNQIPSKDIKTSIHDIVKTALDETLLYKEPTITLKQRPKGTKFTVNSTSGALEANESATDSFRTYSFPGNTAHEAWRFSTKAFPISLYLQWSGFCLLGYYCCICC